MNIVMSLPVKEFENRSIFDEINSDLLSVDHLVCIWENIKIIHNTDGTS